MSANRQVFAPAGFLLAAGGFRPLATLLYAALAPGKVMLTACVQATDDCEDTDDVLRDLQMVCRYKFGIHHATFQVTRDASLM